MLEGIIKSKSKTFLAFCFCFLIGITIASLTISVRISTIILYTSLFFITTLLILTWQNKQARFVSLCIVVCLIGIARYAIAFPPDTNTHVANLTGKQAVTGFVAAEPDVRSDGVRYIVKTTGEHDGKLYLKTGLYPRYSYGDELNLNCKIKKPEPIEEFRYDMFLARFGVFAICSNPKVEQIGSGLGNGIFSSILSLKEVVAQRINELWHEPHASFMAGLLYGYRGGLGSLNELFSITGVTHIVAISGYNITIVSAILLSICLSLYIPRKRAFWIITIGIAVFVIFAGLSASVVRAGIMGVLVLFARQLGRRSGVGNVLVFTAVIMSLHNPFVLIWDAGFQLSFLSTLGLVYVTPLIRDWFVRVPEVLGIRESVISTLAAIIATLPLILYQFGRLPIVAPIVNVLILWIIPGIMAIGFFAVVLSALFFPLGQVIAWIAWAGLQYIILIVEWFAALPFAAVEMRVPVWGMILLYVGLGLWVVQWRKRLSTPGAR